MEMGERMNLIRRRVATMVCSLLLGSMDLSVERRNELTAEE
jgi:hypothetical protein